VIADAWNLTRENGGKGFIYNFTINKPTWIDGAQPTDAQFKNEMRWKLKIVGDQKPSFGGGYPTLFTSGVKKWNYWETPKDLIIDAYKYTKIRFLLKGTWGSLDVFPKPERLGPSDAWDGFVTFYTIPLTSAGHLVNFRATNSDKDIQLRIFGKLTCRNNDCNNCSRSSDACQTSGPSYFDQTMTDKNRDRNVMMYPGDIVHLKREGKNRCIKFEDIKNNAIQNKSVTGDGKWYVPISASKGGAAAAQKDDDFAKKFFVC